MPAKRTFTKGKKPLTAKGATVVQKESVRQAQDEEEVTEDLKPKTEEAPAEATPAEEKTEDLEPKTEETPTKEEVAEPARNASQSDAGGEAPVESPEGGSSSAGEPAEPATESSSAEETGVVGMYDSTESGETAAVEEEPAGQDSSDEGKGGLIKTIGFALVGLIILGGVGFAAYQYGLSQGKSEAVKVAAEKAAATPTPTESDEVDISEYSISILNGSGKSGEASALQETLEVEGFTVDEIGNAEDDIEKTVIKAKKEVPSAFVEKLSEELAKTYVMGDEEGLSSGDTDVVVIIGSETAE